MKFVIPAAAYGSLFRRPAAWNAESKAGGLLFFPFRKAQEATE